MSASTPVHAYLSGPCRPDAFTIACALAGVPVPCASAQAQAFAERCLDAAKIKANLLQKALLPAALPHAEALQLVAKGLRFESWQQMSLFAKRVGSCSPPEIGHLHNAHFFAAALWRLEDPDGPEPFVQAVATSFSETLNGSERVGPKLSSGVYRACFLGSASRIEPLLPWNWASCLDRSEEVEDIHPPGRRYGYKHHPLSAAAYRQWLHRDDPAAFAVWENALTPELWRQLAEALNHFYAFETMLDDGYSTILPECDPATIVGADLVPWYEALLATLDSQPLPMHLLDHNDELKARRLLDQMELCDRLCALLAHFHDPTSTASIRITALYGRDSLPTLLNLRRAYSSMIGMVYAYRSLPWAAIAPFETLPNARAILAAHDAHLTCETLYFVRDVGIRIDDNSAKVDLEHVQQWVARFFRTPGWGFGYSVQFPAGPFVPEDFVRGYATHLRKACTCFDPADPANMEAIEKLRYGDPWEGPSNEVYADIDAPGTHRMLTKRAAYFEAIAATINQPRPRKTVDFRPPRKPLPISIFDSLTKKKSPRASCTCGQVKLPKSC
jgi:hypothetical protein